MKEDVQLRILASAILYRATLRALATPPTAQQKMELHARVEESAWEIPPEELRLAEGREVDEGIPDSAAWHMLVDTLAEGINRKRA